MPTVKEFDYTFDHLAEIMEKFIEAVKLENYSLYVMDYGAPIGYRIASKHPHRIKSLIIQNGNAYDEGSLDFWKPFKKYWQDKYPQNAQPLRDLLTNANSTKD